MHSAESFAQWYTDSSYSTAVRGTLELQSIGGGQYQFSSSNGLTVNDDIHSFCDNERSATLSSGFFPLEDQPRDKICNIWPYWNTALENDCCAGPGCPIGSQWDATVAYGTCDPGTGGALPFNEGEITGMLRNFYFTTEVRYLFRYGGTSGTLAFFGDDDVWVFVNGQLAVDLGGTHERLEDRSTSTGPPSGSRRGGSTRSRSSTRTSTRASRTTSSRSPASPPTSPPAGLPAATACARPARSATTARPTRTTCMAAARSTASSARSAATA
jgi:hypothetical protein